jgi:hypothetical protein
MDDYTVFKTAQKLFPAPVTKPRKASEPSVRCDYCSRGVRGQARKRALHFGGPVFCSRCEREKRQG